MRTRKSANDDVADVARRRLELLRAELAGISRSLPVGGSAIDASEREACALSEGVREGAVLEKAESRSVTAFKAGDAQRRADDEPAAPGRHAHRSIGLAGRVGGWVHDRLPPTLQGSVGLTSAHLTVVALLVAATMAAAAWWVLRADGSGTVVPAGVRPSSAAPASPLVELSGAAPSATSGTVAQAPSAPAQSAPPAVTEVVIDVAGKVRRPGIATLPAGSRVADALKSAGGARRGVDLTALNLARVLADGEQIVVGMPVPSGVAAPAASAPGAAPSGAPGPLVNINTADEAALDTLPGVGPVTAQAILAWRMENGAFTSVDELLEVSGIGDVTLAEMAPFVTI